MSSLHFFQFFSQPLAFQLFFFVQRFIIEVHLCRTCVNGVLKSTKWNDEENSEEWSAYSRGGKWGRIRYSLSRKPRLHPSNSNSRRRSPSGWCSSSVALSIASTNLNSKGANWRSIMMMERPQRNTWESNYWRIYVQEVSICYNYDWNSQLTREECLFAVFKRNISCRTQLAMLISNPLLVWPAGFWMECYANFCAQI